MYYKKLMLVAVSAMLGASFVQEASAWGTGGAVIGSRKALSDSYDLFCDLDRRSYGGHTIVPATLPTDADATHFVRIETAPGFGNEGAQPSFKFFGRLFCAEVPIGTVNPSLEDGVVVDGVKLVGLFELNQMDPKIAPRPGLQYVPEILAGGKVKRTWSFVVPATPIYPFPELLYELTPVLGVNGGSFDSAATKFCEYGSTTNCKALFGLQIPANAADYPARDDLLAGEVFKFSTITTGSNEVPGKFSWGVCHSQAFINPKTVVVDAVDDSSNNGSGLGKDTDIDLVAGNPLAVTVNQNDLWNAGALPRWSNADGLIRELKATGADDSGEPSDVIIGIDWPSDHTEGALTEDFGTLVGGVDGNRFALGTSFNGTAPFTGRLNLFYWDSNLYDNSESVQATIANKSIQCIVAGQPTSTQSNAFGFLEGLIVAYTPTLGVTNTDPDAVLPTTIYGPLPVGQTIASDGSPIFDPDGAITEAWVNGSPVAVVDHVQVHDWNKDGKPDLKIKLNRLDVINALAPGGICPGSGKKQTVNADLFIGNANSGIWGTVEGTTKITLTDCQ